MASRATNTKYTIKLGNANGNPKPQSSKSSVGFGYTQCPHCFKPFNNSTVKTMAVK